MRQPVENWSRGGAIFEQSIMFECMGICVLSMVHECEMRGSLVCLLILKYLFHQGFFWTGMKNVSLCNAQCKAD